MTAIEGFHRWCIRNPAEIAASVRHVRSRLPQLHALFADRPTPFSLTPFLFSRRQFNLLSSLSSSLSGILEEVGRRALSDESLLSVYQFPNFFLRELGVSPGYARLAPILRLDGHFVKGVFRLVETNADGSAGMNDSNAIEQASGETRAYRYFQGRIDLVSCEMVPSLAKMLVRYARRWSKAGDRHPVIGILDIPGMATASEFIAVQEAIRRRGADALIVTPADLTYRSGLRAGSVRLDMIYRRLVTADALSRWNTLAPLRRAHRANQVGLVGSFRSELLHSKAILVLLNDPRAIAGLSPADRRHLIRHVPVARLLTQTAAEESMVRRGRWVIKPLDAYGSRGVSIGRQMSSMRWRQSIRAALDRGRYMIQEYVESPRGPVLRMRGGRPVVSAEMTSVGFFVYDGNLAGPYIRSGPAHPLSIFRGAVTRPGFMVNG